MTALDRVAGVERPSHLWLRAAAMLFALVLGVQCVWLLLAELIRPGIKELPADVASAAAAAKQRTPAYWAAFVGAFRGDLWAEYAFTHADLLWAENRASVTADRAGSLQLARSSLDRALDDGPHQSSAWLLLAGLASRFPAAEFDAAEPLKMSYYTGPSERRAVALRLRIAVSSDKFNDAELRDLVSRDVRLLLGWKQKSAIAEAYDVASPAGKSFIERTLRDLDPSAFDSLRAGATRNRSLPD